MIIIPKKRKIEMNENKKKKQSGNDHQIHFSLSLSLSESWKRTLFLISFVPLRLWFRRLRSSFRCRIVYFSNGRSTLANPHNGNEPKPSSGADNPMKHKQKHRQNKRKSSIVVDVWHEIPKWPSYGGIALWLDCSSWMNDWYIIIIITINMISMNLFVFFLLPCIRKQIQTWTFFCFLSFSFPFIFQLDLPPLLPIRTVNWLV